VEVSDNGMHISREEKSKDVNMRWWLEKSFS